MGKMARPTALMRDQKGCSNIQSVSLLSHAKQKLELTTNFTSFPPAKKNPNLAAVLNGPSRLTIIE